MTNALSQSLRHAFMSEQLSPSNMRNNMSIPVFQAISNSSRFIAEIPNPHNLRSIFFPGEVIPRHPGIPVLDAMLNQALKTRYRGSSVYYAITRYDGRPVDYLSGHSLREAFADATLPPDVTREIFRLKTVDLQDLFEARGVNWDDLLDFVARYATRESSFDDFNRAFVEQHGVDWNEVLDRWYEGNALPAYLVNNFTIEMIEWPDGSIPTRVSCDIFNDSDVEGHVTFAAAFHDSKDTLHYTMPPHAGKRVVFTLADKPREVTLDMHLSQNEPAMIIGRWRSLVSRDRDTARRATPLAREQFFAPGEVIADNEDDSFTTARIDVRGEWLRRWIQEKEREKVVRYKGIEVIGLQWLLQSAKSWMIYLDANAYGLYTRSFFGKRAGTGKMSASWYARVERAGHYDVYVMIPRTGDPNIVRDDEGNEKRRELLQHYTFTTAAGLAEATVDVTRRELGWCLVGRFYLDAGEQCFTLDDRGEGEQVIIGDAVKWVYAGE
jgi:hypothetical protein